MKRVNGKINCKRPCFWDFEHHLKKYLVEIISSIVGCGSIPTFTNPWKISDKWFYHGSSKISGEMVLSETKLHRRNHSRVCNRCLLTNSGILRNVCSERAPDRPTSPVWKAVELWVFLAVSKWVF